MPKEADYPRLVRDNIPEINMKRWGLKLDHRIAKDDKEYLYFLIKKLSEEAEELQTTPIKEIGQEIADIYEIIDSIIKLSGVTRKEIADYQASKRKDQGGFDKRIIMLSKNMPK